MPAVVNRTVFPLSGRVESSASLAAPNGKPWDYAIAGVMFLSAASDDRPLQRATAPIRKDQFDTEAEPGEQSLTGWWLRSQESFHKGAGILYQESRVDLEPSERFRESMGVDVWTPGQITLLPSATILRAGTSTSRIAQGTDGSTDVIFQADGSSLYRVTASGSSTVTWGGTGTILDIEVWDGYYYASNATGVYRGTIAGGAGALLWTIPSSSSVKYRRAGGFALLLADNEAYDVTVEATSPTLPAVMLTLKEAGWTWTSAESGSGTVRAAGYAAGKSAVWTFSPELSSDGWSFAQSDGLPRGEIVHSVANYYNTHLVLGTNRGVRLAAYGDVGQLTFGPLTWEAPEGAGPVRGVHVIDRFVYAAAENGLADGNSGLVRIDPETELSEGRFAWANDLSSGATGTTGAVGDISGRPVFCIVGSGTYIAHATDLVATGYLTTGRIRFRTLEPKLFKYLKLRTDPLVGSIAVSAINDAESSAAVVTYFSAGSADLEETALPQVLGPVESLSLKFTLARATASTGPTLRSYQVKALPAPHRQRIYRLPLQCFDRETFRTGVEVGHQGFALERLLALEAAEEAGDFVTFQDFSTGGASLCVIDEIDFRQTAPPGKSGWGGYLLITIRTV